MTDPVPSKDRDFWKDVADRLRALDFGARMPPAVIEEAAEILEGLAPKPAREYPDPVTAFERLAEALPDGFEFPMMEPNNEPLTHMEILSAVHHHASEIARLTAAVPVECSPQPPGAGQ